MKIYLSGPITGLPNKNKEAFTEAEKILTDLGYDVFNPFQLQTVRGVPEDADWKLNMRHCLAEITLHDKICLLPGWQNSRGARIEALIAVQLGFKLYKLENNKLEREHLVQADITFTTLK